MKVSRLLVVTWLYLFRAWRGFAHDADLRLPNVAKSLQLENESGVLDYVNGDEPQIFTSSRMFILI